MPEFFDYATTQQSAPDTSSTGIRVMSLIDPTQSSSYEKALWELFQQVPTVAEIEQEVQEGGQIPHFRKIKQEILDGFQGCSRMDAHSFARLRRNDRHHPIPHPKVTAPIGDTMISTVRLELWRREPRRSSTSDPDRCVLEFLASQTLADVHQAIVELNDDPVWNLPPPHQDDNTTTNTNNDESPSSGYFLIESQFYSIGIVDYVTPIQKWLQVGPTPEGECARLQMLGLTRDALQPPKPMTETCLGDISWSLATRYHHAYHGQVECAVFATDFHHYPRPAKTNYPLVHDSWLPSISLSPDCDGCQKFPTAMGTSTECGIALGHRALCPKCSRMLLQGKPK